MKKALRLTVALMAALAFTTAWAGDEKADKEMCGDKPCATEVTSDMSAEKDMSATREMSEEEVMASSGSGAGEPYGTARIQDETYQERWQHELWQAGD